MGVGMRYVEPGAAIIGGAGLAVALAVGVSVPLAVGIGVVALVIADARRLSSALHPAHERERPEPPVVPLHPDEQSWVTRADDAVSAIHRSILLSGAGPLQERLAEVATDADGVLEDLRRLAAHVTATRQASSQLDLQQLSTDLDRLTGLLESSDDPDVVRDLQRSVDAVREQLRIGRRLASARTAMQARIESGGLGLQHLAAQVSEMTALTTPGTSWQHGERIDDLTTQLEALREGLSDAGSLSRRALAMERDGGGDDDPVAP